MTLKRLMVAFACICVSVGSIAQVKESVVRVRPIVSEAARGTFLEAARFFIGSRHTEESEWFRYLADSKPVFSGFLISIGTGEIFVLTTRVGVAFSATAEIVFTLPSGMIATLENCPIVYKDTNINVALIRLDGDIPESAVSLELYDQPVTEGQEVWAAGYSVQGEYPVWRLAEGVITNLSAVNEYWGSPEAAVFLHHSAKIAPGCTGGPVLVSTDSGYKVAGLNCWYYSGDWYQCGAVPASFIREALGRMKASDYIPEERLNDVEVKAEELVQSLTEREFSRFKGDRLVSASLGADKGWFLFKEVMQSTSNPAVSKEWNERFYKVPGDTCKHLVWYRVFNKLHSSSAPQVISMTVSPDSRPGRFLVRTELKPAKGRNFWVDWGWECGNWLIFSTNAVGPSLVSR